MKRPTVHVLTALSAALLASSVAPVTASAQASLDALLTRAEATDFVETSSYDDVMGMVEELAALSDRIHLTSFGYTNEGRRLPLLVLGWLSTAVFLQLNGVEIVEATNDDVYDLVIWIASANPPLDEIVPRLRALVP